MGRESSHLNGGLVGTCAPCLLAYCSRWSGSGNVSNSAAREDESILARGWLVSKHETTKDRIINYCRLSLHERTSFRGAKDDNRDSYLFMIQSSATSW